MNRRTVSLALWIVAALFVALLALGPTAASAHPGHHEYSAVDAESHAHGVVSKPDSSFHATSAGGAKAEASVITAAAFFVSFGVADQNHSTSSCMCCIGAGCCTSVCVIAPVQLLPIPASAIARLGLLKPLDIEGTDPSSLLDPPKSFV